MTQMPSSFLRPRGELRVSRKSWQSELRGNRADESMNVVWLAQRWPLIKAVCTEAQIRYTKAFIECSGNQHEAAFRAGVTHRTVGKCVAAVVARVRKAEASK